MQQCPSAVLKDKADLFDMFPFIVNKSNEKTNSNNVLVCLWLWLSAPNPMIPTEDLNL